MSSQELSPPFVRRLLNRALKDPSTILDDKRERFRRPEVHRPFFDYCEAFAYEKNERALELAGAAVAVAERIDDRHVVHRGLGVQFNAAVALAQWGPAIEWLRQQERAVAGCCPGCQADHLLRRADLALEHHRLSETFTCLDDADRDSLRQHGDLAVARTLNFRGMALHHRGEEGAAIEAVGTGLATLPLEAPQLFFRDSVGLLGCFLRAGERATDERVLEILDAFKDRLADLRGWFKVRNHVRWLEGILLARCDAVDAAEKRLERVRWQLKAELGLNGPVKPRAPEVAPAFTDRRRRIRRWLDVGYS